MITWEIFNLQCALKARKLAELNIYLEKTYLLDLVTIINSLVFTKLYYCSSVWSNTSASNIRKLQGVQNFAARIVSGTRKFDHVSPALKDLRWIPVKSHLYLRDAILAFKSTTGQVPNYLSSTFISRRSISGRTTRSSSQLNIPLFKTKSEQRSFYYRTVTLWNALKPHFKLSESLTIFKRKMKSFLLNQFLMSNLYVNSFLIVLLIINLWWHKSYMQIVS